MPKCPRCGVWLHRLPQWLADGEAVPNLATCPICDTVYIIQHDFVVDEYDDEEWGET